MKNKRQFLASQQIYTSSSLLTKKPFAVYLFLGTHKIPSESITLNLLGIELLLFPYTSAIFAVFAPPSKMVSEIA